MKKQSKQISLIIVLAIFAGSFFLSIPVTAQQTSLIFPIFKYSSEQGAFWTILGIKSNDFVAITDNMELESSKQFVIYGFSTADIGNISVQVDVYDSYEIWTDDLGIQRVNATQSSEPVIRESYLQKIHKIELELPEANEFKTVKIAIGSSYFVFQYKTLWDFQTTVWTNIDFFTQVQLINWAIILLVAFAALGVAIAFVSKARCIPPFTQNPIPQLTCLGFGAMLAASGISMRPPNMFSLTAGVFSIVVIICMQLWSLKTTNVKEALFLNPELDKPVAVDIIEAGGDAYWINRASWRDTIFRLFGLNYTIADFYLYKRSTATGSTSDYLLYGSLTEPKAKWSWKEFKPVIVTPCKIDCLKKTSTGLVRDGLVQDFSQDRLRMDLKDVSETLVQSIKNLSTHLEKKPLLFKFPRFRRFLKKIPLIRRLTVFITPQELLDLQELRAQLVNDIELTELRIDKLLADYRKLQEEPYELNEEMTALIEAGERIEQLIIQRNRYRRELHTREKIFLGAQIVEWELAERGKQVETDLPQKDSQPQKPPSSSVIIQEVEDGV